MTKNKTIAFTISDNNNLKYYEMLKNSWAKWHPDIELKLYGEEEIKVSGDPMFFYRATPRIGRELLKEYDTVIKIDADSIITADLSHTWEGEFNVGVVQNSNPREMKTYPVGVWDIVPLMYVNCGYVVMKSAPFVEHWWALCTSYHFNNYQMKEQDLLNIMVHYCGYPVKYLDSGEKWHGLAVKGYGPKVIFKDGNLILPKDEEWPQSGDKQVCIYHFAGGNDPTKGNYHTIFQPEVVKHLDYLTNEKA